MNPREGVQPQAYLCKSYDNGRDWLGVGCFGPKRKNSDHGNKPFNYNMLDVIFEVIFGTHATWVSTSGGGRQWGKHP